MPVAPYNTSYLNREPYLTIAEYKAAPTAVDVSNLVTNGNQQAQDDALTQVVARASAMVDAHCNQILAATTDVENQQIRVNRRGEIYVHPWNWPVLEVTSVLAGLQPSSQTAVDLTNIWIEKSGFKVPGTVVALGTGGGLLEFGGRYPGGLVYVTYTYVNGWANSTVRASSASAQPVLALNDVSGMYAGTLLTIYDGANTESVTVLTVTTGATPSVTCSANLQFTHAAGVSVSALPPTIKQATILLTSALIKTRGNEALVMRGLNNPTRKKNADEVELQDITLTKMILQPFKRVR